MKDDRLIRLPEVLARTGASKSSWYEKVAHGEAPASIKIGARAVAWSHNEIVKYIERLKAQRDASAIAP